MFYFRLLCGQHTFLAAAAEGDVHTIGELLSCENVDVNLQDCNQWTALHFASAHGRLSVVKDLLYFITKKIAFYCLPF